MIFEFKALAVIGLKLNEKEISGYIEASTEEEAEEFLIQGIQPNLSDGAAIMEPIIAYRWIKFEKS